MGKLLEAYYPNKSSVDAIRSGNIALLSDIFVGQNVLKSVVLQANANNKIQKRNTFFFRYSLFYKYKLILKCTIKTVNTHTT